MNIFYKKRNIKLLLELFSFLVILFLLASDYKTSQSTEDKGDGFFEIFNGETLDGWEGDSTYWRVENGTIVGEVTEETLLDRNSFLIWRNGLTGDFEIKVEYRVSEEGNSGINYRSQEVEGVPYALRGYQADLDGQNRYTGMNYDEGLLGVQVHVGPPMKVEYRNFRIKKIE